MAVGHGADLLAELGEPRGGLGDLRGGLLQVRERPAHTVQLVALLLGAPGDLYHRPRHLPARRRHLLARRRQVARGPGDAVRLAHDLAHDPAQPVAHDAHRVGEDAELAQHPARGHRSQVAAAEPLGGRHQPGERPAHLTHRPGGDRDADEDHREQHQDEQRLASRGPVAESLGGRHRPLGLPGAKVAHQARQLLRRLPHHRRLRRRFPVAPQILQGVGQGVVDLDR